MSFWLKFHDKRAIQGEQQVNKQVDMKNNGYKHTNISSPSWGQVQVLAFRSARKFPSLTNTNPLLKARTLLTLFVELANSLSRFFVAFFELNFSLSCLPAWQDIRGCLLKETTGSSTNNWACTSFPNPTSQLVCNPDRKTMEILMNNAVLLFLRPMRRNLTNTCYS